MVNARRSARLSGAPPLIQTQTQAVAYAQAIAVSQGSSATLQGLPTEILCLALDYLDPQDFVTAICTSRIIHARSDILRQRHKALLRQFSVWGCDTETPETLTSLLHHVIRAPKALLYVRNLIVIDMHQAWQPQTTHSHRPPHAAQLIEGREQLAGKYVPGGINTSSAQGWLDSFGAGREDFTLLLLLCILKNLTSLTIYELPSQFDEIIERIEQEALQQRENEEESSILSQLRTVRLTGENEQDFRSLALVERFANFPHVREIAINAIHDSSRAATPHFRDGPPLQTESLLFQNPSVTQRLMHNFLRNFPSLKSLQWDERDVADQHPGPDPHLDCFWLCVSLSRLACASTLKELIIRPRDFWDPFIGDLTSLRALTELRVDLPCIINPRTSEVALLPESLTKLFVWNDHRGNADERRKAREQLQIFTDSAILEAENLEDLVVTAQNEGHHLSMDTTLRFYRTLQRKTQELNIRLDVIMEVDKDSCSHEVFRAGMEEDWMRLSFAEDEDRQ